MELYELGDYFSEVDVEEAHDGYYYSVHEAIIVTILGSLCGLKSVKQIHEWAVNDRIHEFLRVICTHSG